MENSIFSSCEQYLFKPLDSIRERPPKFANQDDIIPSLLSNIAKKPVNEQALLNSIQTLIDHLKCAQNVEIQPSAMSDVLLPLINSSNDNVRASAYVCLQYLSKHLDQDELAASMMDQLISIDWQFENAYECYQTARLSAVYVEFFGRGLERMTRPRDWMLFLPFLANYFVMVIDVLVQTLIHDSSFGSSDTQPSLWDKVFILISNNCLDLIQFLHSRTVAQDPAAFPFGSKDIGKENGDTKRRYLAHFLTSLLLEKVIANFDMQLSETYFKMHNPVYASRIEIHRSSANANANADNLARKPMYAIVHRTMELADTYGLSFEKMHQLQTSIVMNTSEHTPMDDDMQMINSRLYPLSYNGVAMLLCLSLYDKTIYPKVASKPSIGLFDDKTNVYKMAQKYIGIVLNLATRCSERACETDKAVFIMSFMAEHIQNVVVSLSDLEKMITGPCGSEAAFPASRIFEIISTVASTCPDPAIRFVTYKLIEKFINYGDEKTQYFLFEELLGRCPYPSMKVAAIGLLKDHICKSLQEKKVSSVFAGPAVVTEFVPLILQYKEEWAMKPSTFWDDYAYIMQALVFYRTLYQKDKQQNLTALSDTGDTVNSLYLEPLSRLLDKMGAQHPDKGMQLETLKHQIELVQSDIMNRQ